MREKNMSGEMAVKRKNKTIGLVLIGICILMLMVVKEASGQQMIAWLIGFVGVGIWLRNNNMLKKLRNEYNNVSSEILQKRQDLINEETT